MLEFRKLKLSDKNLVDNYVLSGDTDGSAYSFGTLYAWGDSYQMEIAEYDGFLLMRGCDDGQPYYVYPSGTGNVSDAVNAMIADNKQNGCVFLLGQLLENNIKILKELYPDKFEYFFSRDYSEYVYPVENMAYLPGKKFHGKKGHINAFFRNHTDVHIDPITVDNIHHCLKIQEDWLAEKGDDNEELLRENLAIEKAVKNFEKLGFTGAILYADGNAVAFTMGEPIKNNTFCTHYEKTLPDYRDAFPVINNGFTKLMLLNYKYVNREEDAGSEGLRKAKLSYYPEFLVKKYTAMFKNDPMRKYYVDSKDFDSLAELWTTVFGDESNIPKYFINNAVDYGDIYAYKVNGKIVSAFYLVDGELVTGSKTEKVKYLYAAATLKEYRGQGIMSQMVKYSAGICALKDYRYIALCPADEGLYGFYENLGFKTSFKDRIYVLDADFLNKYKGARYFNVSVDYSEIRNTIPAEGYLTFNSGYIDYSRFLAKNGGFEISVAFDDEDKVFIIGTKDENTITIDEAISADGNYGHIFNVIADLGAEKVFLKTPECIKFPDVCNVVKNSGMLLALMQEETFYDNLYLGQPCM